MDPKTTKKQVQEIYTALNNQISQQAEENEVINARVFNAKLEINREDCIQTMSRKGKNLECYNKREQPQTSQPDGWLRIMDQRK